MTKTSEVGDKLFVRVENIHLRFGGIQGLIGVSTEIKKGEITAIIGPNGAGKTCLLNCISGFYRPQQGSIYFEGKQIVGSPTYKIAELGISRTFQNIGLFTGLSVVENLLAARHRLLRPGILSSFVYFGREHRNDVRHRRVVEEIIDFLEMEAIRDKVVGTIPYGMRKRVELGRTLATEPKLILLDEVMAGMNIEEKEDMARFIIDVNEERGTTIMLVEHDMGVVMDISDKVIVLDFGSKLAEGTPQDIMANSEVIRAYLGDEWR